MDEDFLKRFAEAMEIDADSISMDSRFRELEEWDSMNRLSVVVMLDEEYNVQIEEQRFSQLETLQELYKEVIARSNG